MGVAKTVYRYTGSDKFKLDYPNDLKKAVDVLEDDITMEKYALSSTEIPKSKRKRYKPKLMKNLRLDLFLFCF